MFLVYANGHLLCKQRTFQAAMLQAMLSGRDQEVKSSEVWDALSIVVTINFN